MMRMFIYLWRQYLNQEIILSLICSHTSYKYLCFSALMWINTDVICEKEEDIKLGHASLKQGRGLNWLILKVAPLADEYTVPQELWNHSNNHFSPHTWEDIGLCTPMCGHYEGWRRHHRTLLLEPHSLGDRLGHSAWGRAALRLGSQLCRRRSQ